MSLESFQCLLDEIANVLSFSLTVVDAVTRVHYVTIIVERKVSLLVENRLKIEEIKEHWTKI